MNLTDVGGDNFCTFHQQPHSEKKCPQWLNSKVTKDSGKEEKKQTTEKQDDDTMFLWNGASLFNTEEKAPKPECPPTATKSMDLEIKDNTIISKIKKLQENVKRQIDVNVKNDTPEVTAVNQEADPINEPVKQVGVNEGNNKETKELKNDIPT